MTEAHGKHAKEGKAIQARHAALQERVDSLERSLDESHHSHKHAHGRLEKVERHGDSLANLEKAHAHMSRTLDQHRDGNDRLGEDVQELKEALDKQVTANAKLLERLGNIEGVVREIAGHQAAEAEALKARQTQIHSRLTKLNSASLGSIG